jgi:hypothetical protein
MKPKKHWADEMGDILGFDKVIDESALTLKQMAAKFGVGIGSVDRRAKKGVAENKLEKVWKKDSRGVLVPAYRPKRVK